MIIGYVRISSKDQNQDRQIQSLKHFGYSKKTYRPYNISKNEVGIVVLDIV